MTDVVDRAQDLELMHLRSAIDARRHKAEPGRARIAGVCNGCGDDIPAERLAALPRACLCVDCQDEFERGMGR